MMITLLFAVAAHAQDQASMTGSVTDSTGAAVPETTVTLVNVAKGTTQKVTTDKQGVYRFANVSPGPGYVATFSHDGFSDVRFTNLYLNVGITRTQDAKLNAGTSVQVEVSAAAAGATLNTTDASIGNNFDIKLLNDLPVQVRTSPAALFTLQPGYANGSFTGARADQNEVTVDGMDVNDIAAGSNLAVTGFAPVDAVQEFRGVVAGMPSNVGTGSGGQFQLVTKSGTNQFHGNLNEYHRDTATAANTWFNNNSGLRRTPLIRNQFGGNIGGPILKDKLFFFFDFNNSRTISSQSIARIVPLDSYRAGNVSYIKASNNGIACGATSRQNTTPGCIGTLTPAQIVALDPQHIGFSPAVLSLINARYPHANDLTGGDGINTGYFRFTTPTPDTIYNYVGRLDYNLTSRQRIFARITVGREDATQSAVQFPTDPVTNPYQDRSYGFVVSHVWQIGQNKVNQFYYGENISKLNFPSVFNPTGTTQLSLGGSTNGNANITGPYNSGSSQKRRVPIPEVRDDFNWQIKSHNIGFGGTFKFVKTNSSLVNDFNFVSVGLGGENLALDPSVRPADIRSTGTTASTTYDTAFATALGRIGAISSNYNYNNSGTTLAQGTGAVRRYRFFQTELYVGDTWKVTPKLTLTYGLRYQLYSVPYEANGAESIQNTTFNQYFATRVAQSAAGRSGANTVPFITYNLGGKANNAGNLYAPNYKDFAPRFALAYQVAPKTVVNASAALVYDRTVINAVNFIQDQSSYLFQNSANTQYGASSATAALLTDPRVGLGTPSTGTGSGNYPTFSYTNPNRAPAITKPYTPFADAVNGPYGLAANQFNTIVDPTLKDPYSITMNAGVQQEMPGHMIFRLNYAGRLGRRLLAQADASQLVDFIDTGSGQSMSAAFGGLTRQLRAGSTVTAQPWIENQLFPGATRALANSSFATLINNGDLADVIQALAADGYIDYNVGLASQFAGNTFITNKGFSNYHGLLFSLTKNLSQGLQFDFNYTWSHSIDNTSKVANYIASGTGLGFICDVTRPRECRGNSDFDTTHVISSDFVYDLPFGHGRSFGSSSPWIVNELIGGWTLSGTPGWRSGYAFTTTTSAFVAGYANNAPAIFNGNRGDVAVKVKKDPSTGSVYLFGSQAASTKAQSDFVGPIGLTIGSRNNLRGPTAFSMDAGLAKSFPILPQDRLNLKFRADFFNVLNHPTFGLPTADITSGSFGQITSTTGTQRIGQFALRLEF